MRLIKCPQVGGEFELTNFTNDRIPPYAILSHTWGDEEVTYNDISSGTGKHKTGHAKIRFCGAQAAADGLQYFWVDTCCIDKSTSDELSTAINSMFRWYQGAAKCYVYLSDVSVPDEVVDPKAYPVAWREAFRQSRWFTRGWTLQELIAPPSVEFYTKQSKSLGSRVSLEDDIHDITKIPVEALRGKSLIDFSVEERIAWATGRNTTKEEDKAYCLLGIFGVFLPLIYGEGEAHATMRLKEHIQKQQQGTQRMHESSRQAEILSGEQTAVYQEAEYLKFLRSISYPEMEYRFHNIDEVEGDTYQWLLEHVQYRKWLDSNERSPLLMIWGKPGSGKSTAMKRACNIVKKSAGLDDLVISFFFNSRGVPMETKLEGFFRSMLHQLLECRKSPSDKAFNNWKRKNNSTQSGWVWTVKELQDMFIEGVLHSTSGITMFVDSLDECESPAAARDLVHILRDLSRRHHTIEAQPKICISSRHYPNVRVNEALKITVEETNQDDITRYIKTSLEGLQVSPETDFSADIASRANGMFLWASLMLKRVRDAMYDGESQNELRAIINRTPQDLEEFFRSIIATIATDEREQSGLMFSWVLLAKRPLHLAEFVQALVFRTKYQTYQHYKVSGDVIQPVDMRRLLAKYTRGLIEAVDTRTLTNSRDTTDCAHFRVQFIHESVRQYMLSRPEVLASIPVTNYSIPGYGDDVLAQSCFNYIKAVCNERDHVSLIQERIRKERIRCLSFRSDSRPLYLGSMKTRPFLEYAIQFGFTHAKAAEVNGRPPLYLFHPLNDECMSWWSAFVPLFRLYWAEWHDPCWKVHGIQHWSECAVTPIAFACAFQLDSWAKHLSDLQTHVKEDLSQALCIIVGLGDRNRIPYLIETGADVDYEDHSLGTPLCLSLALGRDDIFEDLLIHGASVCLESRKYSPLLTAIERRPLRIVRLLLEAGAKVTECESLQTTMRSRPWSPPDTWVMSKRHALEAAVKMGPEWLEALLPYAESQKVPIEYYKAAWHATANSIVTQTGPDESASQMQKLELVMSSLFPAACQTKIEIFLKWHHTTTLNVWEDTRISHILGMVHGRAEGSPWHPVLTFDAKRLHEEMTLLDYGITQGSTIYLTLEARWRGQNSDE